MTDSNDYINQDIKVINQAIKQAIQSAPDKTNINIVTIGQIRVENKNEEIVGRDVIQKGSSTPLLHKYKKQLELLSEVSPMFKDQIEEILEKLPEPKMKYLMVLSLQVAVTKADSYYKVGQYLGIGHQTAKLWMEEYGLSFDK